MSESTPIAAAMRAPSRMTDGPTPPLLTSPQLRRGEGYGQAGGGFQAHPLHRSFSIPLPHQWERFGEGSSRHLNLARVVRRFSGDHHVVDVAFAQARAGDADEAGAFLEAGD